MSQTAFKISEGLNIKGLVLDNNSGILTWDGANIATESYVDTAIGNISIPPAYITSVNETDYLSVTDGVLDISILGLEQNLAGHFVDGSYYLTSQEGGFGAALDINISALETQLTTDGFAKTSDIPSLSGYATESYVGTAITNLIDGAPSTLDTLKELALAINNDASYASTLTTALGTKQHTLTPSTGIVIDNSYGISVNVNALIGSGLYRDSDSHFAVNLNALTTGGTLYTANIGWGYGLAVNANALAGTGLYSDWTNQLYVNTNAIVSDLLPNSGSVYANSSNKLAVNVNALTGTGIYQESGKFNVNVNALLQYGGGSVYNNNGHLAVNTNALVAFSGATVITDFYGNLQVNTNALTSNLIGDGLSAYDKYGMSNGKINLDVNNLPANLISGSSFMKTGSGYSHYLDVNVNALAGTGLAVDSGSGKLKVDSSSVALLSSSPSFTGKVSAPSFTTNGVAYTIAENLGNGATSGGVTYYSPSDQVSAGEFTIFSGTRVSKVVFAGSSFTEYAIIDPDNNGTSVDLSNSNSYVTLTVTPPSGAYVKVIGTLFAL